MELGSLWAGLSHPLAAAHYPPPTPPPPVISAAPQHVGLVPGPEIEPAYPCITRRFLTTGPPEKSQTNLDKGNVGRKKKSDTNHTLVVKLPRKMGRIFALKTFI